MSILSFGSSVGIAGLTDRIRFEGVSLDLDETVSLFPRIDLLNLGIARASARLGPTLTLEGEIGLPLEFIVDAGLVDLNYDLAGMGVVGVGSASPGLASLGARGTAVLAAEGLDLASSGVDINVAADLDIGLSFDAAFEADLDGTGREPDFERSLFSIPIASLPIDAERTIVSLRGSDLTQDFNFGFGTIDLSFDEANPVSGSASGFGAPPPVSAGGRISEPVLTANLEILTALGALVGIPREVLRDEIDFSFWRFFNVEIDYTLLAADVGIASQVRQDFDFDPDPVGVTIVTEFGEVLRGVLGDNFTFDVPEGEGTFDVEVIYDFTGTLTSDFDLLTSAFLSVVAGAVGFNVFGDFELDIPRTGQEPDIDFGFNFGRSFSLFDQTFQLFDLPSISLFESTQQVTFPSITETFTIAYERPFSPSAGDDNITLTASDVRFDAGAGNDRVIGNALNNILIGGVGQDTLIGLDGNDGIEGGDGSDSLVGNAGDDNLLGFSGNDTAEGATETTSSPAVRVTTR